MRKTICASVVLGLFLSLAGLSRADEQADLRAIIDKAIKAQGGEEKLAKFKATTMKGKGTYYGMGMAIPYTAEWAVQMPDRMRVNIDIDAGGQKINLAIVLDRDKGWRNFGGDTQEMEKEQVANQRDEMYAEYVAHLVPLKDKAFTFASLGELKVNERPTVGIKVSQKDKPDVSLYFDKETHLLAKIENRVKDEMSGQEVNQESFQSDYKESEGVKYASKTTTKRDGKVYIEVELSEYKSVEKHDDSVFAKP